MALLSILIISGHRLGDISNKHVFLIVLEDGKCRVKVLHLILVSGEVWLPGLWNAAFWLYHGMAEREEEGRGRKRGCANL